MGFISSWAQGVIVAVIIATIIEMILPQNSNGKYVKVVIGIFVLFTIISPIINKFHSKNIEDSVNVDSYIKNDVGKTVETSNTSINNDEMIKKMYEENLKVDIKSKIKQKGYITSEINLQILNNEEYSLNKIEIKVASKIEGENKNSISQNTTTIVENIENIKVSLGGSGKEESYEEASTISESEKNKLRAYLSGVYEVSENNIIVK